MDAILPGEWVKIFEGVDLGVMAAIGIIAFVLERSHAVPKGYVMAAPLLLGLIWGIVSGFERSVVEGAHVFTYAMKGALYNGGAASVAARGVSFALDKYWTATTPSAQP